MRSKLYASRLVFYTKVMPKFTDQSQMQFGKYRGQPLEKIPAKYLLWLLEQMREKNDTVGLYRYLEENRTILEQEANGGE